MEPKLITVVLSTTKRRLAGCLDIAKVGYGEWDDKGVLTIFTNHKFISAN